MLPHVLKLSYSQRKQIDSILFIPMTEEGASYVLTSLQLLLKNLDVNRRPSAFNLEGLQDTAE